MAQIENYRALVKQLLSEYASYKYSYGEIETQTVFDSEQDHYQSSKIFIQIIPFTR